MPGPGATPTDVLVIGGGPAGSTVAALLARKGWQVTLLEKARHPRFHIGESLMPMNLPILERLGVLEQVRAIGVLKLGADFPAGDGEHNTFSFNRALGTGHDYAFHVRREEFDQLLFEHARNQGVDARDEVRVERVDFAAEGGIAVHARTAADVDACFRLRALRTAPTAARAWLRRRRASAGGFVCDTLQQALR